MREYVEAYIRPRHIIENLTARIIDKLIHKLLHYIFCAFAVWKIFQQLFAVESRLARVHIGIYRHSELILRAHITLYRYILYGV